MASPAQINANRLNALRSTGPRSEEGKSVSRFNALSHGIEARSQVIPGEDPAELEALSIAYHSQFHPVGPLEDYLVNAIVTADWNRRRYTRIEAYLYRVLMTAAPGDPAAPDPLSDTALAFGEDAGGPKILEAAFRRLASAERSYFRALKELRRAQNERLSEEREPEKAAAPADAPVQAAAAPPPRPQPMTAAATAAQPAEIGFVPGNPPQTGLAALDIPLPHPSR